MNCLLILKYIFFLIIVLMIIFRLISIIYNLNKKYNISLKNVGYFFIICNTGVGFYLLFKNTPASIGLFSTAGMFMIAERKLLLGNKK